MKLIQQLLEMAKGKSSRASQAKRRKKKKAKDIQSGRGTADKHNPAAKAMSELEAGVKHGAHATTKDKARDPKHNRRKNKVTLRDY